MNFGQPVVSGEAVLAKFAERPIFGANKIW